MHTKIIGLWPKHDCSATLLDDGVVIHHTELERHLREKEPAGDAEVLYNTIIKDTTDIESVVVPMYYGSENFLCKSINAPVHFYGHHMCHAAHAFYSSNFDSSIIITLDGGGVDLLHGTYGPQVSTAATVWLGNDKKLQFVDLFDINKFNIGGLWTRVTRYVFRLQNGWPRGNQAGTIMAMAAVGDPNKYFDDFWTMLTCDIVQASVKPKDQPFGAYTGNDPKHPYLWRWTCIADQSEQEKFDLAASLQAATEKLFHIFLTQVFSKINCTNVCFAGGVALNSVMLGKVKQWFPHLSNVFVPPVPYDGGLCIGAAQYRTHHQLNVPRVSWKPFPHAALGIDYAREDIIYAIQKHGLTWKEANDDDVIDLLDKQQIVSLFSGRAESGRRALGHRSIVADPRNADMKQKINDKVKHRQWFRPFAPSILSEELNNWLETTQSSPYMSFVAKFRQNRKDLVPAVVHLDGTGRYQTVHKEIDPWWHGFISKWQSKTGVPILLNTSFNDSEPIVESPEHAVKCFNGTDIDVLYFPEHNILAQK